MGRRPITTIAAVNNGAPTTGLVTFSGPISGSGSLNLVNADFTGTVLLSGNNTDTGGTFVNGPTVVLGSSTTLNGSTIVSGAVGTGTLTPTGRDRPGELGAGVTVTNTLVVNQPNTSFTRSAWVAA